MIISPAPRNNYNYYIVCITLWRKYTFQMYRNTFIQIKDAKNRYLVTKLNILNLNIIRLKYTYKL